VNRPQPQPQAGAELATSDEALAACVEGIARKDRAAAGRLVDLLEKDVNRIVWALLGADSDHDDVVQDALVCLLRGAARVRSAAALRGWARTVTVNCVRQELRRRRWRRLFSPEEEGLSHPDLRVADEATRARALSVWGAVRKLPAEERLALVLRHVEGYELEEVAAALGCSLATAKRRLQSAQARLEP